MLSLRLLRWIFPLGWVLGCGNNSLLQAPTINNVVDTVTISAFVGTPIDQPSAYSIAEARLVRTDQVSSFDFAYNQDLAGRHTVLPLAALGLGGTSGLPGLLVTPTLFDNITLAQLNGYSTNDTIVVVVGSTYYARSRIVSSCILGLPYYAKMEFLAFDDSARTATFRILNDNNCGYKGLKLGLPSQ